MATVEISFVFFDNVSKRLAINNSSAFFIEIYRPERIGFTNLFFHHNYINLLHFLCTLFCTCSIVAFSLL